MTKKCMYFIAYNKTILTSEAGVDLSYTFHNFKWVKIIQISQNEGQLFFK